MSFVEAEYLPFLALLLLVWPFVPARGRLAAMLAASCLFYVARQPAHAALLFATTAIDFLLGRAQGASQGAGRRRALLGASVALNLGLLVAFKYGTLALPLGISFYTFQRLSYAFDVHARRIAPCRRLDEYALYVTFFPLLSAGPIERAGHLLPQLRSLGELTGASLSAGGRLILWGLLKKWVCADRLISFTRPVFYAPESGHPLELVIAAVAMVAVLYLDFSAYTDLARGTARLFGVELVKNFDRTFLSTSIYEWARRWHMSLVAWMYDYVWAPLVGGSVTLGRLWRANLVTMTLFGLWHGASSTFVVWGLAFGVAVSLQQSARFARARAGWRRRAAPARGTAARTLTSLAGWTVTMLAASQLILVFFSPDLAFAGRYLASELDWSRGAPGPWALRALLALLALLAVHAAGARFDLAALWRRAGPLGRLAYFAGGTLAAVAWRAPVAEPFVYFRF